MEKVIVYDKANNNKTYIVIVIPSVFYNARYSIEQSIGYQPYTLFQERADDASKNLGVIAARNGKTDQQSCLGIAGAATKSAVHTYAALRQAPHAGHPRCCYRGPNSCGAPQ